MMDRYNKYEDDDKKKKEKMDKLNDFVVAITKGKKEHEIVNELFYYVSVAWESSWTQESKDIKWLENKENENG